MVKRGILNPSLASLLCRFRHTNTIVVADRGFPSWPGLETVDLSLVDGIPTVVQVLEALKADYVIAEATMAEEFKTANSGETQEAFHQALGDTPIEFVSHLDLKSRVPGAIGLIRTGDTVQYANVLLVSG